VGGGIPQRSYGTRYNDLLPLRRGGRERSKNPEYGYKL